MKRKQKGRQPKADPKEQQIRQVNSALSQNPVDTNELKEIGQHQGFVNTSLRAVVWPKILHIDYERTRNLKLDELIYQHKDTDQVARDVERSLWKFTVGNAYLRKKKRAELSRVVNGILSVHKELNYYQGLHDVASVFLLVANSEEEAFAMTERVCLNQLRYALNTTLDSTKQILNLLFPIIQCTDVNLFNYLQRSTVEPFFALSWILTWFSHSLDSLSDISRLFDLFLTSHPLMSLYVSAQIVIHFKDILLNNIECDFCAVHGFLSNLPPSIPIDNIIKQTINLYNTIPPSKLQSLYFPLSKSAFMNNYPYEWLFDSIYINKSITKDQQTNKLTIKQNVQNQEKKIEPFRKEKIVFYGLLFVFIVTSIIVFKT